VVWCAGAALCFVRPAIAQTPGCTVVAPGSAARGALPRWESPLDRVIAIHTHGISLGDALDRVAVLAGVRISYSPELLRLDREVCLSVDSTAVGNVLVDLLTGMNVVPVPGGGDQIVLAPRPPAGRPNAPEMAPSLEMLKRVVVTDSGESAPARERTIALDVVTGRQLARDNATNLSSALDAYVPGVWSWSQSPSNILGSFASMRGASSFGLSYPKIYIDGIEVANPLLVTRFSPDAIDRIEVIRGPQGSALYGTDAISGVINIVSRHDAADTDGENVSVRSSAGVTQSAFAHGVLRQEHSVSLVAGSEVRSADLHVTGGSIGDFIPNGYSHDLVANGAARFVGARTTLDGTARFFMEDAGSARSPLLTNPIPVSDSGHAMFGPVTPPQSVREYTIGATGTLAAGTEWTHTITAGIDGYSLANVQMNTTPIRSIVDSALDAAQGTADRGTLRVSSVFSPAANGPTRATFTFTADAASLRETSVSAPPLDGDGHPPGGRPAPASASFANWQNSTGVGAQANIAMRNTFFLTTGLRTEYDTRLAGAPELALLPMLGGASVGDFGPLTVKLRAAYGKGIRPPSTFGQSGSLQSRYGLGTQASLGAEEQSGIEAGVDVLLRHAVSFQVTRFDQRASGLIQQVAAPADSSAQSHRMTLLLENVGEIANRGWELEASTAVSRLTASGTLSFVDSRVTKLATGYTGDVAAGDRMLQVPAKTGSLNLSWQGDRWTGSLGGSRALDWINYDEIALSQAILSGAHSARDLVGPQLRQYWRVYSGGLRVRAALSRDVWDNVAFDVRADNLLNYQRGEPDNITVVPGRTVMTGLRVKF
jgi:outer membrane receptor for ferrienterochelin and colicin